MHKDSSKKKWFPQFGVEEIGLHRTPREVGEDQLLCHIEMSHLR